MIHFKRRVSFHLAFVFFFVLSAAAQEAPLLRIGLIADIQYGDIETQGSRYYRNSLQKLEASVADLNSEKVGFTLNLGDLTDRRPQDLDPVISILKGLSGPFYNTTGNHDYVGVTDNEALYQKLGMPSAYYSFERDGWVFVMLNTNEIASYSNIAGTNKEKELTVMMERIRKTGRNNGQTWNGGISGEQMKWLNGLLKEADRKRRNVLVLSHHPLYPAEGYTALNDAEILAILAKHPSVKGVISGHHHVGAFADYEGIPFITTEGMVETGHDTAYGILEIFEDRFVLKGKGRTKTHTVKF